MGQRVRGATMCAEFVGNVMLVVHSTTPPSADDWTKYCDYAGSVRRAEQGVMQTVVITAADAGPDATQRAEYKEKVAGTGNRVAVLCQGNVTRAILTAMSWFNADMKPFGVGELDAALEYLGTKPSSELQLAIEDARAHLGLVKQRNTA